MTFPRPNLHCTSPMSLDELRKLLMQNQNDERIKMEGYNESTLCGKEMCRVLSVGLNATIMQDTVMVRDVKITDDGKFKITITDVDSTLKRANKDDIY